MLPAQRWVIGTKVKEIAKDGYKRDRSLGNALIDMYTKCASLMLSRLVLRIYKVKMRYLCMCPSNILIIGYVNIDLLSGYPEYGMLVWLC